MTKLTIVDGEPDEISTMDLRSAAASEMLKFEDSCAKDGIQGLRSGTDLQQILGRMVSDHCAYVKRKFDEILFSLCRGKTNAENSELVIQSIVCIHEVISEFLKMKISTVRTGRNRGKNRDDVLRAIRLRGKLFGGASGDFAAV